MIGILGGMGPRATVEFEARLLRGADGIDQELPPILCLNDGRIPDRSAYLLGEGPDPLPTLVERARQLQNAGAKLICIPCNSAQSNIFMQGLRQAVAVPFVDLPQAVVDTAVAGGFKSVFLLATAGMVSSGTYQKKFQASRIVCRTPDSLQQGIVDGCIKAIKQHNAEEMKAMSAELNKLIRSQRPEAVILGCTELPLMAKEIVPATMEVLDTLDILVAATLASYQTLTKGS